MFKRLSQNKKKRIADNLVSFMMEDCPLLQETVSFIYSWVRRTDGTGASKGYYDVWDMVLKKYYPKERPVLFRSCYRLSKHEIQSFTGKIYAAHRFSEGGKGHVLVCDTKEYMASERETVAEHELSFFPLRKCVEKAGIQSFPSAFCEDCAREDEYIVRVRYSLVYDLKWNKD